MVQFKDIILYEDKDLIVVNKPAGISSLKDRSEPENLLKWANKYHKSAQLCHRLDKETSGTLVISKNLKTYRHISLQFMNRKVKKIYKAVTKGLSNFENKEVDLNILNKNNRAIVCKQGKKAISVFNTLKIFRNTSLIDCKILTGRFHQIRAHLSHLNFPIIGDKLYGGEYIYLSQLKKDYKKSKKYEIEKPIINRIALHAYKIGFENMEGEYLQIDAPITKDFSILLKILEKN